MTVAKCATLVQGAYDLYEAEKNKKSWDLPGDSVLIAVLRATPKGLFAKQRAFGFICRDFGEVFVVFRGTESWGDWLSDGMMHQTDHPMGQVHKGGSDLYAQMADTIKAALAQHIGFKVTFTGHSLGGWLATLAAADVNKQVMEISRTLITFASPRTGDVEFAKNFNAAVPNAIRVINSEDIVPTMPLPMDYCHIGTVQSFTDHTGSTLRNHAMGTYARNI